MTNEQNSDTGRDIIKLAVAGEAAAAVTSPFAASAGEAKTKGEKR